MATAIEVTGLGKRYVLGNTTGGYSRLTEDVSDAFARILHRRAGDRIEKTRQEIWALRDVDLEVAEGDVVGIIGRNGAGKSTFLKIMSRITEPTEGRVVIVGRVASLLEVGTGFHPELTGRENIFLNGAILGMSRRDINARLDEIVEFAEVSQFIDTPVKRYSSGMAVRLAFAVAAHLEPEILIVDEVLAVGDLAFQRKCMGRMTDVARSGRTVLFVSHNMGAIQSLCTRGVLIERGHVVCDADPDTAITRYVAGVAEQGAHRVSVEPVPGRVAQVTEMWVEDESGTETPEIEIGSDATVVLRVAIHGQPRDVTLAVLVSRDGTPLLYTYDSDVDPEAAAEARTDGVYEARVRVPFAFFKEGAYRIAAQIGHAQENLTDPRAALDLTVLNTTIDATHRSFRRDRPGQLYTQLEWNLERLAPRPLVDDRS